MRRINYSSLLTLYLFTVLLVSWSSASDATTSDSAPVITEHPLDILVVKGDPATLRCASSGENVQISWYKDGELVPVGNGHRLLLPNGSLFLLKVTGGGTDSDSGTYYCIAKNQHGEVRSQEASVRIALLRDEFRTNPRAVQATIGSSAVMECTPPKAFPEPVVAWRKDERELNIVEDSRLKLHPTGNLIIENIQRSDAGLYQCVARNMVGERVSKAARLTVYEKPRFIAEPKDAVAEVNGSVLFDCRVTGEPTPSISWKKSSDQMPIGRAYVTRDSKGLKIDRVQSGDAGEYVCTAKNSVGVIEASVKLKVNSPPSFTKYPQNVRINTGRSAVFECEAEGHPTPNTFWSKEGDQHFTFFSGLISSDGRIQVTSDGRLIIDDVRPIDQGRYVCAAVNAAGSTLAKASLEVISSSNPSFPPPVIEYGHQNQTLTVNDTAILPCLSKGRVPTTVSWLKNGQQLNFIGDEEATKRYKQLASGTLQISDLRKSDSGIFTCRAKNEDGEATWTASLAVEEHTNPNTMFQRMPEQEAFPSQPGRPTILSVAEDSVELEWTPPKKQGSSPIIGYILQYWSPELKGSWQNVLDVVTNTRFVVRRLEPTHSYAFVVRAENSNGIGLPSEISDLVTTNAASSKPADRRATTQRVDLETARTRLTSEQLIKLQEVRALNATAVQLVWKRQRKEPLVQGYYIKWRGPPLDPHHPGWVNISEPEAQSVIINGLRPYNNYEFFIIPYHQSVQGMPSNSLDGTTFEAAPSLPPSAVTVRMLNKTSLRVSWRPPPEHAINGVLKGFLINIRSNQSEERNITTNERATSVTLYRLISDATYVIRIAARTNADWGPFYSAQPVHMNDETLVEHLRLAAEARGGSGDVWYKRPWSVLAIGILLWFILILLIVLLWYRCCYGRKRKAVDAGNEQRNFIKIRDGSVANQNGSNGTAGAEANAMAFWANHDRYGASSGPCIHSSHEGEFGRAARAEMEGSMPAEEGIPPTMHPNNNCCTTRQLYSAGDYVGSTCGICDAAGTLPKHATHQSHPHAFTSCAHGHHHPHPTSAFHQYPSNSAATMNHVHCPYNCSTMRKSDSQSPPHHYHYAYLPDGSSCKESAQLSTFNYDRDEAVRNKYYDDPSPYATTTLVGNSTTLRHSGGVLMEGGGDGGVAGGTVRSLSSNRSSNGGHPALPLTRVPTRAPAHFLSKPAVDRIEASGCCCCAGQCPETEASFVSVCPTCSHGHYHAQSCSTTLLDAIPSNQHQVSAEVDSNSPLAHRRSTAVHQHHRHMNHYTMGPGDEVVAANADDYFYHRRYHQYNQHHHHSSKRHHNYPHHVFSSSTIDSGRGGVKHSRSSSVNNSNGRGGASKWKQQRGSHDASTPHGKRTTSYQQESPPTDVSYVQGSSDGTNGSSKAARNLNNLMDMIPPPPCGTPPNGVIENPLNNYDAVAEAGQIQKNRRSDPSLLLRSFVVNDERGITHARGSKIALPTPSKRRSESDSKGARSHKAKAAGCSNSKSNRISLLEDSTAGQVSEADPLMSCNFEADGELSDNDCRTMEESGITGSVPANGEFTASYRKGAVHGGDIEDNYIGPSSPLSKLPIKQQPAMGVNGITSFTSQLLGDDGGGRRRSSKSRLKEYIITSPK